MSTRKDYRLSRDRDLPLLDFLWRWKVATTRGLTHKFFPGISEGAAYNRISWLRRHGLIQYVADPRSNKYVWMLTRKGFQVVKPSLRALRAEGYGSEAIAHDLITAAVHLGDWLKDTPDGVELFSEQELRRIRMDCYPDWVPKSEDHRPDGYWRIKIGNRFRIVALETEIGRKSPLDYEMTAFRYASFPGVARVLWMTKSHDMARVIHGHLSAGLRGQHDIHDMALIGDFIKSGWNAPIVCGPDAGKSIAFLLNAKPMECASLAMRVPYLDTRKCPYKSKTSLVAEIGDFGYRVGFHPTSSAPVLEQDVSL